MIRIFYKQQGEIMFSQSCSELTSLGRKDVLWIDLLDPIGDEKRSTEAFIGTEIQSRAQAEEIESSSRFSENGKFIFANTNFLSPEGDEMGMDPVSFILAGNTLVTLRDIPLRSFNQLQTKMQARPALYKDGFSVFMDIVDKRVDLDADIIELISQEAAQFSKRINQKEDINEEFLLDINQLQENAMIVRENVVDKQRLLGNILKSDLCPDELDKKFGIVLQDIASLINHINFTFERLEYLQDTVLGVINLDQNRIMKIFTFISLLLMPATLVASFYGMNVKLPGAEFPLAWLCILGAMAVLVTTLLIIFRKRKFM
ncbi:MAG: magnesium and cobalt transport protein CorA [Bacteroidales bacterium]|nr:magnesium and cobalt transport protein CorA [Bacteroidales bacterium]